MQEYTKSIYYFIRLIIKWKTLFIAISIIAAIASTIFSSSWFIKPKYKSFSIIYPSNLFPYSTESSAEQMLQLFGSSEIRNAVIRKFNLADHYNIDLSSPPAMYDLFNEYESNISVTRTEFESIEIKVLDTDPTLACAMVNEIIKGVNTKARALQREKTQEILLINKNQLSFKKKQLDSASAILQELRVNYNLLNFDIQVKEYSRANASALASGKGNVKGIETMLTNLQEKGGEYYSLSKTYEVLLQSYNETKLAYDNTLKDLNKVLTYTSEVTPPVVADKKSYPVRWVIVVISVISANLFLFTILVMGMFKNKAIR